MDGEIFWGAGVGGSGKKQALSRGQGLRCIEDLEDLEVLDRCADLEVLKDLNCCADLEVLGDYRALMMVRKSGALSDAPPMSPPSTSGFWKSSAAFLALHDPP